MVRKVVVCALCACLCFTSCARRALAVEDPEGSDASVSEGGSVAPADGSPQPDSVINVEVDQTPLIVKIDEIVEILQEEFREDETEQEPSEDVRTELDVLESIEGKMDDLKPSEAPEIESQEPVGGTRAPVTFTAYANVSPTGTYATYAAGYLPRVGFDQHYVYVQDTSSSYTFVWGDLSKSGNSISGSDCNWVRWYYVSQGTGYLMQSGTGQVTVDTNSHVVLSDLDGWPMLDGNADSLRKEVGFYAVVALAVYCLHHVWSFVLRNHDGHAV